MSVKVDKELYVFFLRFILFKCSLIHSGTQHVVIYSAVFKVSYTINTTSIHETFDSKVMTYDCPWFRDYHSTDGKTLYIQARRVCTHGCGFPVISLTIAAAQFDDIQWPWSSDSCTFYARHITGE